MARRSAKGSPAHEDLFFSKTYDFLNVYLVRQAGRSEHTRKSYRLGLGALYDHVTHCLGIAPQRFTFGMCTYELLIGWSQRMQGRGLAASTVNSRLAAVRSYLRYSADVDPSLVSVWLASCKVPTLAVPKRQRPIIEAGDLAAFLGRLADKAGRKGSAKPDEGAFLDVSAKTSHAEEIWWMAASGVSGGWEVSGGREFRPNNPVKRGDMAAFLHRLDGVE